MAALRMPSPEAASKRWHDAREVISRTAELLCSDLPLDDVYGQLCAMLAGFVEADRVFIALAEGQTVPIRALHEGSSSAPVDDVTRYAAQLEQVISSGRRVVHKGGRHSHGGLRTGDHPNAADSAIYVPLRYGCSTIGVLAAQSDRPDAYDDEDVRLLESCASFLALRVHDAGVAAEVVELRSMAAVDQLTGIANRRAFDSAYCVEWRRNARDRSPLALIMVDVDLFKSFNDHCGHVAGDACLRQVASAMAQCLRRPADLIARFGGEEFAVILPGTSLTGALTVAERLRSAVSALGIVHSGSLLGVVSISVGAASVVPEPSGDAGDLLRAADHALYRAKVGGRNRVVGEDYVSDDVRTEPRVDRLHNLPAPLTDFLGRDRELAELRSFLKTDRLVTVVGPGGAGKTRLALRVGEEAFGSLRDGVWFVDLAPVDNPADLASKVRAALSLADADVNSPMERIIRHLRNRELLLVLDNCEHIATACAEFAREVLAEAPAVRILATSRQALRVTGEAVVRLGGMPWPKSASELTAEKALRYEAVRLFERRARSVGQFMLSDDNVGPVVDICRHLDGVPLAIELAAARTAMMTAQDVAAGLAARFELLDNGDRSGPARQHTLRALLAWSYDLLGERERAVLCRLAVFSGSFTLVAAEQVVACGLGGAPLAAADAIAALVEKSLLSVDREADQPRFHLLESTRAFALEQLGDSREAHETRASHAAYFADLARDAESTWGTRAWQASSRLLARERENLRSALQFSLEDANDPSTGARIATSLCQWWHEAGLPHEGRRWIKRALSLSAALDDATHARLWYALGRVHIGEAGDAARSEAIAASECAAKMFSALGDNRMTARSLQLSAKFYSLLGDYDRAELTATEAVARADAAGDLSCKAMALNNLGVIANYRSDHTAAIDFEERAAAIFESIDDEFGFALATGNIADSALALGDYDRAATMFRRTLSIHERGKNRFNVGLALSNLGGAEGARGNVDMAIPLLTDAMDVVEEYRDHWLLAIVLTHLATALVHRGSFVRVAALLGASAAGHEKSGIPWSPSDKQAYDRAEAAARQALGDSRYQECAAAGRSWDLEQALGEARRI